MNNDQRLTTVISATLMLATLALGWFALADRLSFPKIAVDRSAGPVSVSEQDVTARLWEDPLQAVQAEVSRAKSSSGHAPENLAAAVQRALDPTGHVCLLVVPIPGTPFPDDVETRLRLRYSVQMAMAQRQYSPADRDHLGHVRLAWPGPEGVHSRDGGDFVETDAALKQVDVPYEWFAAQERPTTRPAILTLWLPEGLLGSEPLCRLAYLRHVLIPQETRAGQFVGLLVVGPRSSDTLKRMVSAGFPAGDRVCRSLLEDKLCFFSPQATAPDALIGLNPTGRVKEARASLNTRLKEYLSPGSQSDWSYFQNSIAPDDQLTDLLVQELRLRGVNFTDGQDRVLLLAEADTSYGRSLPLAFRTSVQSLLARGIGAEASLTAVALLSPPADTDFPSITVARYLRGLDTQKGFQGREVAGDGNRSRSAEQLLSEALNREVAPAFGESQLDYVERLSELLAKKWPRNELKAVGVLGGDLYDKLVLLRTLRREYPEALFFTTDLDARLWDPLHLKFTRNLVVASSHNLLPSPQLQAFGMPPFRDVYQATVFNACVAALDRASGGKPSNAPAPTPDVYEIGRHGGVRLTPVSARNGSGPPGPSGLPASPGDSSRSGWWPRELQWAAPLLCLGGVLALGLLVFHYRRGHKVGDKLTLADLFRARTGWVAVFFVLSVAGIAVFGVATRQLSTRPGAEPWSWGDGVSIWPTELVRLVTVCSVVWMLLWAWASYAHHRERIVARYYLEDVPHERWAGWIELWHRIHDPWPQPVRSSAPVTAHWINADGVFRTYLVKAGLRARCARVATGAVLYASFAMVAMAVGGMPLNMHIRGDTARLLDGVILGLSVVGLLALVFYVLDAVWMSSRMLDSIARPFTVWPSALLQKHADDLGVEQSDLEGYLDVGFAAEDTRHVGRLVFLPFVIQFLMLVSRNRHFDNWSWPPGLVVIFVCNMLLAATAWAILRRSAAQLREFALESVLHNLRLAECDAAEAAKPSAATTTSPAQPAARPRGHPAMPAGLAASSTKPNPTARRLGLQEIRRRIEQERRGAYARWIQDPAFLAMMIPTGLLGLLSVLFQALFGFR